MVTEPNSTSPYARRPRAEARSMSETFTPATSEERTRQLSARIPESLHKQIRQHLVDEDITVQEFVRRAVTNELARKAPEDPQ